MYMVYFFFFKQKTAYEMRISDWSSDVCSSDLSSTGFIHAVQIYPYTKGALYRLYAAPERVADIALQPGEMITSVAAGDTVRWTVGDTTSGSGKSQRTHILVKPFAAGLHSNMVITTDRRVYHLELERSEEHTSELQSLMRIPYAV